MRNGLKSLGTGTSLVRLLFFLGGGYVGAMLLAALLQIVGLPLSGEVTAVVAVVLGIGLGAWTEVRIRRMRSRRTGLD